ncbi:globin domain-containing protein [Streptomyces humidus]|uniref:globin domain-containing protein n=1 Tax=Streptomyces humidus TaxID=52259 RepID=UPI00332CB8F5
MTEDYHSLLARREAMRLRDRLLAPAPRAGATTSPSGRATGSAAGQAGAWDGAADQELIVRNLDLVTPFGEVITLLYEAMFERHPYLRKLFPDSMEFQRTHLEHAFRYTIENLHRSEQLAAFFTRLGRDHRKLGVRPVHYQVFEDALTEALRRYAGERWRDDVEQAWLRMLRFVVAAMVNGADGALAEPASWGCTVTRHERRRPDLAVLRVRTFEPYPYRPGQYATLQSPLLPHAWRPYSLARASAPDGELEFHIRRTGPGGLSDALVTRTGVGDSLRLGPVKGTMTLDEDPTREVLIVAGGTGWAPARALLEELAVRRRPGTGAYVFVGARTADDLYDAPALARLENRCPWLRVVPVTEGPGGSEDGSVVEAVARYGDWTDCTAYVSGPPAMVIAAVYRLTAAGVPADRIHHDPVVGAVAPSPPPLGWHTPDGFPA